ncbi:hypothetical protein TNCV_2776781 [Trichonephila clavipes]|nr:hypothetical protein TNCV_2776781 [Trichonephila clavipes]
MLKHVVQLKHFTLRLPKYLAVEAAFVIDSVDMLSSLKLLCDYSRVFGDGPRNFEPWPSDGDDTGAGTTSANFHSRPEGGRLSFDIFNMHRPPLHGGSSVVLGSNSRHASHDFVTLTTKLLRPPTAYRD